MIAFRGVMAGGFFCCQAYVPLMLVEHRGATPTMAGLAVAATAIGWSTGAFWQGRPGLSARRSALVRIGAAVAALGVVVTSTAAIVTDQVTVPAWLAGVGLLIGGLGMGLSMASNAVLLFEFSPVEDRGANSAAIQMSDSLGGLLVIGAGGVIYALWRDDLDQTPLFLAHLRAVAGGLDRVRLRRLPGPTGRPGSRARRHIVNQIDQLSQAWQSRRCST